MRESVENVIAIVAEVYPEIPLFEWKGSSYSPYARLPVAHFGEELPLVALTLEKDGVWLAEPRMEWVHPHFLQWSFEPRFKAEDHPSGMSGERKTELQARAKEIAASRLAKYGDCVKCGERMAPEHLEDYEENGKLYCSDCAHRHLGVIH